MNLRHYRTVRSGRAASAMLAALGLLVGGCRAVTKTAAPVAISPPPAPVLIHLPGIAGELPIDHNLMRGLLRGDVAPVGSIIDWTGGDRGIPALTNVARHASQAKRIAAMITTIFRHDPRTPIVLIGHSGGAGVAVQALEDLPSDVHVRTLVLLAAALSPDYDLSNALAHVDGRAISLFSQYDGLVLGTGTRAFGTYDRVRTDSAGYVGFHVPAAAAAIYSRKFTQIPYDPAWMQYGNDGSHIGVTSPAFARRVLARLIKETAQPATRP